jgi:hypothetical protein
MAFFFVKSLQNDEPPMFDGPGDSAVTDHSSPTGA